jgi:hypothetical protein
VLKSDYSNFEIILVDNASTDGSFEIARRRYSNNRKVRFLLNKSNLGYAEGNNRGLKASNPNAEYVAVLNIDTKVDPKWLRNLILVVDKNEDVAIATCKMLQMDDPVKIDTAGGLIDPLGFTYMRGVDTKSSRFNKTCDVFYGDGSALLIRKKALKDLEIAESLFDPLYFCYYEELDLCWRVRLRGYRVIFVPSSIIYHKRGGIVSKREEPILVFHKTKNKLMTLIKCYETRNVLKYVPIAALIEILAGIIIMPIYPFHGIARLKGVFWIIRNLRKVYERRKNVQRLRKVSDMEIMKYMERSLLNKWFKMMFYFLFFIR